MAIDVGRAEEPRNTANIIYTLLLTPPLAGA